MGLFIGNIMTLAREHGLHTCPQAAWREYESVVHDALALPEDQRLICGLAVGYEDTTDIVNELRTERAPLADFVEFR